MRVFRPGHTWLPGNVVKCFRPVSFTVKIDVRRHQDHLSKRSTSTLILTDDTSIDNPTIETATQQSQTNPPHNCCHPN